MSAVILVSAVILKDEVNPNYKIPTNQKPSHSFFDNLQLYFFIKRPIFATVIAILMVFGGLICLHTLPVSQIGLILLLGMSAKNAILIVEFARDYHKQGVSVIQAGQEAGQVWFRPIMMTALAFVFGVLPMLFATGPGANSRIALGTAIVFGMAMNAFIGTLFVPTFWAFMQNLSDKIRNKAAKTTNNSVV